MNYKNQLTQNNEALKNILSLIPTLPPEQEADQGPEMATLTWGFVGNENWYITPLIYYYDENYQLQSTENVDLTVDDDYLIDLSMPLNSIFLMLGHQELNLSDYPESFKLWHSGILPIYERKVSQEEADTLLLYPNTVWFGVYQITETNGSLKFASGCNENIEDPV